MYNIGFALLNHGKRYLVLRCAFFIVLLNNAFVSQFSKGSPLLQRCEVAVCDPADLILHLMDDALMPSELLELLLAIKALPHYSLVRPSLPTNQIICRRADPRSSTRVRVRIYLHEYEYICTSMSTFARVRVRVQLHECENEYVV